MPEKVLQTPVAAEAGQQRSSYHPQAAVLTDEEVHELQQAVTACLPQGLAASERLIHLCDFLLQVYLSQLHGWLYGPVRSPSSLICAATPVS